jgi:hypothetical protein
VRRPRLFRRIALRFARLPSRRKSLIVEAVLWLALARIALVAVPFRHLAARFGTVANAQAALSPTGRSEPQEATARDIGWAVTRAARYVPFRAVCLPQAIAAKAMLDRRDVPSTMHFGVKKPDGGAALMAHAWLDAGTIEVTGYPVDEGFVEVARFV